MAAGDVASFAKPPLRMKPGQPPVKAYLRAPNHPNSVRFCPLACAIVEQGKSYAQFALRPTFGRAGKGGNKLRRQGEIGTRTGYRVPRAAKDDRRADR